MKTVVQGDEVNLSRHSIPKAKNPQHEIVLILQGGGSLGAYECGVFKELDRHGVKFDVVVGTSIGAINASIIAGSKEDDAAKTLEGFWLELSETMTSVYPESMRSYFSTLYASIWGNPHVALPVYGVPNPWLLSLNQPFLYDNAPLKRTLTNFVDFEKLNKKHPRVILTSVDIQKGKSVSFDSNKTKIDDEHIMASAGYPFYGISWTKKDGRYLWDGSLLSNTPLREAIEASPTSDKHVYMVDLFPSQQESLPKNMVDSWHRARDIIHSDKTQHNVRMSKVISRYIDIIKKMHDILQTAELDKKSRAELQKLEPEYHKLASKRGAIIQDIIRVERKEDTHFLLEDADFSLSKIKHLIAEGQRDTEHALRTHTS
jgi:NTE family protein